MKKVVLLCIIICSSCTVFSQSGVSIFYGQTQSKFKYENSSGASDIEFRTKLRSSYGINFMNVFKSGVFIRPGFGFNNFGAVSDLYTIKLDWSLSYIDLNFGCGYVKRFGYVAPYVGASPYFSQLYNATQTVGTDEYDLISTKLIKKNDYGFNVFGGVKYFFTEAVSVHVEVKTTTGLMQLETNSDSGESQNLYNRAVSFQFGISFNMVNKNKTRIKSNF